MHHVESGARMRRKKEQKGGTVSKEELMTATDAGKVLGITPAGVRAIAEKGGLAYEKTVSGFRIFRRSEVEKLAQKRKLKAY